MLPKENQKYKRMNKSKGKVTPSTQLNLTTIFNENHRNFKHRTNQNNTKLLLDIHHKSRQYQ